MIQALNLFFKGVILRQQSCSTPSINPVMFIATPDMEDYKDKEPDSREIEVEDDFEKPGKGYNKPSTDGSNDKFYEWLAGIIDGDGCFLVSKKGYCSLEIVTQLRDKKFLYQIKQKFGGA